MYIEILYKIPIWSIEQYFYKLIGIVSKLLGLFDRKFEWKVY